MKIKIQGAWEHNLKNIDVSIKDGVTAVTGVSGSGKTSLIFDTLYKEARRRFLEAFSVNKDEIKLNPAKVRSITGIGPTIALGQNLLNRNPNSIVASAIGFIPLFKLLYARFGDRKCHICGAHLSVLKEDEIIARIYGMIKKEPLKISALLVKNVKGSHQTLLELLEKEFGAEAVLVDGIALKEKLNPNEPHTIQIQIDQVDITSSINEIREIVQTISRIGGNSLIIEGESIHFLISRVPACVECGTWFGDLDPTHFTRTCPHCKGIGCRECNETGYHPLASNVTWEGLLFPEILTKSVGDLVAHFSREDIPISDRLLLEIKKRLIALHTVGLEYLTLDRVSPTLSRGESQRVRLAVALLSELEDVTHILDEPTIGQHPADVARLIPLFQKLAGLVIYIEHDRQSVASADHVIDMGPGAGNEGGEIIFTGTPAELWKVDSPSGLYFSLRKQVEIPKQRALSKTFFEIKGATMHNLKNINVKLPFNRLTVVTGVSGSGKSTLIKDVLFESLKSKKLIGCKALENPIFKSVLVDQDPIGKNPRSNPATYTKIADSFRELFGKSTRFKPTFYSFNTTKGACETCKGMGALEIKMRYLPSNWITCSDCDGQRFSEEVLSEYVKFGENEYNIAEFYNLPISEVTALFEKESRLSERDLTATRRMLEAMNQLGLGYLSLGQPSPTLSGGEAQRIKLSKYLGRDTLKNQLIILDEPSTGLHPQDLAGLLTVLDRLIKAGATVVVVEHNIDVIRAADWIIDLGPGSGPKGGNLVYEGPLEGLVKAKNSLTGRALLEEQSIVPLTNDKIERKTTSAEIVIQNAHIHNLKNIDVKIPKNVFTVVTGISGSGKSSLIMDTLEAEARRRFLETLSMYERQGTKETSEAQVENINGLGITTLITPEKMVHGWFFNVRNTIGRVTDMSLHLANILSYEGERKCPNCDQWMERKEDYYCNSCKKTISIPKPKHFIASNYSAACLKCHGVGSLQIPNPNKLIIHPDKPLCSGAMYSPGFFPKGYLGKPYNVGYYIVQAIADRYGFDRFETPWNEMSEEAKNAFLYGVEEPLTVEIENKKGQRYTKTLIYKGFYGQWLRDWDVGGTYMDNEPCEECSGTKFRPQYLAVSVLGYNIHQLSELSLLELHDILKKHPLDSITHEFVKNSLKIMISRLDFLIQTGLGYINLNRVAETLSAGEAQRVKLAGLLGSDLTSLTVLLDEPSRGLHPSELQALLDVLLDLRDKGNTVITIEHDLLFIKNADYIIDMGPGAGVHGGEIVAEGSPNKIMETKTTTADWLNRTKRFSIKKPRRKTKNWLKIYGAKANNLKGDLIEIPHGLLVGLCGVSGSGKSTILIDTLARVLVPIKHTTSVAREPIEPGEHDRIEGALPQTIVIDQATAKLGSPLKFLDLERPILKLFAESEDANVLGLSDKELAKRCSVCKGHGFIKTDMKFLPDIVEACEVCKGSGFQAEAWQIRYNGISLPEVNNLTIDEAIELFNGHDNLISKLRLTQDVGLGYLQLNQPAHTLSGGEAQRLKIAKELSKKSKKKTLYILDEPTIGQHLEDISKLVNVLHLLVQNGHTVVVIEHHPHLLVSCDWLIELGPGAGPSGGRVIASGTPETLAEGNTPTAPYIKEILEEIL